MSTFVKNYYSPKNPDLFLAVSWETGYRNIQVFHNDRLMHTIKQPGALIDGVKIQDEELGKIKFRFTDARPRKLEIKVNNRKFKTVNKLDLGYDYTGLIAMFTSLSVLAAIESFVLGGIYDFQFAFPVFAIGFFLGLLIAVIYGVTSYLLSKKKAWFYFVGTGVFTITTLISAIGVSFVLSSGANYFVLIVRLGMLLYILLQAKHILKEVKKAQGTSEVDGLLDS